MTDVKDKREAKEQDVVILHGPTPDGEAMSALRARPGKVELARLQPVKEGQALNTAEVVQLHHRQGSPLLWDVEVIHKPEAKAAPSSHPGPARVSTDLFRTNWEAIFGKDEGPLN